MKLSEQIISKGSYIYSCPDDPVAVAQYVFIRQRGQKCLLLRFKNNSEFPINKIDFEIIQIDKNGREIGRSYVKTPPLNEPAGGLFTLSDGFGVKEECVDFRISFISLRSGDYKYTIRNHSVDISFIPPKKTSTVVTGDSIDRKKSGVSVISKKPSSFRFALTASLITVLVILASVLWSFFGG